MWRRSREQPAIIQVKKIFVSYEELGFCFLPVCLAVCQECRLCLVEWHRVTSPGRSLLFGERYAMQRERTSLLWEGPYIVWAPTLALIGFHRAAPEQSEREPPHAQKDWTSEGLLGSRDGMIGSH